MSRKKDDQTNKSSVLVRGVLRTNKIIVAQRLISAIELANLDSIYFVLNCVEWLCGGNEFYKIEVTSPACIDDSVTICHYLFGTTVFLQLELCNDILTFDEIYLHFFFLLFSFAGSLSFASVSSHTIWDSILPTKIYQTVN